ncbi:MAG: iron-containing alcohol dehydrogenase [Thermodesulfobacterium sp.]|nr:iron-containing alcohol dehydrogenase [Thermodesulfobacterium sp.]
MENFEFYVPTKIVFGKKTEEKIGKILKKDGIKKVLFVYGRESIKKIGLYDKVVNFLKKAGIEFIEHSGVKPNPVLFHTIEGIKKAKESQVSAILTVGGGSVIDEGKTIAVGAKTEKNIWKFFKREEVIEDALPIYTILTVAATGSEMNGFAVITNEETKEKLNIRSEYIFPRVSILNPELTYTVSSQYQAYASVDVIAHIIEYYFTCKVCPNLSNRISEGLIKTVMETTEIILKDPRNYNARAEFMWASSLALNGLTRTGVGGGLFPNHLIAHALGGIYDLPHGACLSIVIPSWMQWYKDENRVQFEKFAKEIFGVSSAEEGIKALKDWFKKIGAPVSLKEINISENEIPDIAENGYNIAKVQGIEDIYSKEVIEEILKKAL